MNVPLRHGMTVGELARMFNVEQGLGLDLTVVPLEGWRRDLWFDETGLPWTNPSPNMRNLTQAILYPGVGLLESAVSVGRGTDTPFELVGAPYVDDVVFAQVLNSEGLPGVSFTPVRFTPTASTYKGQACGGVRMLIIDRKRLNAVDLGLTLIRVLQKLYPAEFDLSKIQHLLLNEEVLEDLRAVKDVATIRSRWKQELQDFAERRRKHLLY
jgi:uncharacterized protein YbbC (DUF1343 family)